MFGRIGFFCLLCSHASECDLFFSLPLLKVYRIVCLILSLISGMLRKRKFSAFSMPHVETRTNSFGLQVTDVFIRDWLQFFSGLSIYLESNNVQHNVSVYKWMPLKTSYLTLTYNVMKIDWLCKLLLIILHRSTSQPVLPVNRIMLNSHTGSHYHRMQKKQNSRWCWMLKV